MSRIGHALIMAAGRGVRMRPLTDAIPKAMAPLGDQTLVASVIDKLRRFVDHIHITVGYKRGMLAEHVVNCGVASVFNTAGRGNAWWIYNTVMRYLNEPIIVLTCDNVVDIDFHLCLDEYLVLGSPACMVVPVEPVEGVEGDYVVADDRRRVTELTREPRSRLFCSGIQVLNPARVNALTPPTEDFHEVWGALIVARELGCSGTMPERWYAVDDLSQLRTINGVL